MAHIGKDYPRLNRHRPFCQSNAERSAAATEYEWELGTLAFGGLFDPPSKTGRGMLPVATWIPGETSIEYQATLGYFAGRPVLLSLTFGLYNTYQSSIDTKITWNGNLCCRPPFTRVGATGFEMIEFFAFGTWIPGPSFGIIYIEDYVYFEAIYWYESPKPPSSVPF